MFSLLLSLKIINGQNIILNNTNNEVYSVRLKITTTNVIPTNLEINVFIIIDYFP